MRDRRFSGRVTASAAVALVILAFAASVQAATCGGEKPCKCGATVEGSAVLDRDLTGCPRVGLHVAAGAKLDCAGHKIEGLGKQSEVGHLAECYSDAEVRGCTVSGFDRGSASAAARASRSRRTEPTTTGRSRRRAAPREVRCRRRHRDTERNDLDGIHLASACTGHA
jgi:hypothetical protein